MYNFATAPAWILFAGFGTVRLTVCLSSSVRIVMMGRECARSRT
jgi:hypothetical protein